MNYNSLGYKLSKAIFLIRDTCGSRTFPLGHLPRTFPPEKNANNVLELEAGMIKQ